MNRLPKQKWLSRSLLKQIIFTSATISFLLLLILAACSSQPEVVTVEVTRVVTETVVVEGETVEMEVTRVVTETVIETVEIEGELEEAEDEPAPPSATGSEDDSGPLPPAPDEGPKVTTQDGSNFPIAATLETAVPLRANQEGISTTNQVTLVTRINESDPLELDKICRLFEETQKKRCR